MKALTRSMHKVAFAKALRRRMTPQEKILWEALRRHTFYGLKFKRQVPIGNYIVDFFCHKYRLIIEVDGGIHQEQREYDQFREDILALKYFKILRFTNEEIDSDLNQVLQIIHEIVSPSPQASL